MFHQDDFFKVIQLHGFTKKTPIITNFHNNVKFFYIFPTLTFYYPSKWNILLASCSIPDLYL